MTYNLEELKEVLVSLGYSLRDDGNCWRTKAVYRNGDNSNSLVIYKDSGCWHDYGAGVFSQPINKLLSFHGLNNFEIKKSEEDFSKNKDIPDRSLEIEKIYPESILKKLLPHYKFYIERGVSEKTLSSLKSGMATSGSMYQRYVFPIYNSFNQIIGFSGRYMGLKEDRPKWKHLGKKNNWVYPLYLKDQDGNFFVKDSIRNTGEVIIVESIGDLLALHTRNIYNVLVCFGLKISNSLICGIIESGASKITLSLNNDFEKGEDNNTGKIACIENFLNLIKHFDYNSICICLPIKKDFGEMNDFDFKKWLDKKASINYDAQRDLICEQADELKKHKKITSKSYKNLKELNCE